MMRVDLLKEKIKDRDNIAEFVDKLFENNSDGLLFHHFE